MYVKEGSRNFWKFSKLSNSTTDDSSSFAELLCYLLLSNVETLGLAKETNSKCFKMISKGGKCFRNHSKPSKTSPEVIFERIHILWYSRPELGLGRPVRRAWARVNTWILTFPQKSILVVWTCENVCCDRKYVSLTYRNLIGHVEHSFSTFSEKLNFPFFC